MGWLRIDDQVPHHIKMLTAGPSACWLWLCGVAYCQRQLSDGFVPTAALSTLGVPQYRALVPKLVAVGLWDDAEGGYRVHDYHDHNPKAEHVKQRRRENAERVAEWKRKRGGNTVTNGVTNTTPNPNPNPNPNPVRGEATPSPPRLVTNHAGCASCGRVCVPPKLHDQFRRAIGGDEYQADIVLSDWYRTVHDAWGEDGPHARDNPGAEAFKFWKARFDEWRPAAPSRPAEPEFDYDQMRKNLAARGVL